MEIKLSIFWTKEAKVKVDEIRNYLNTNFGENSVADFMKSLKEFENIIAHFPKTYQESTKYISCRLGLVHPHVSAIYTFDESTLTILTLIDNRTGNRL